MKSCFATHNFGKVEYLGSRSGILSLFDMDSFKMHETEKYLQTKYSGQRITFQSICEEIIDDTFYLEKDIRSTIQEMKKNSKVTVTPVSSKTSRGLKEADIVTFNGDIS